MTLERPPSFRFGPFLLDMARRQLSRDGTVIPLRPKDLEILALLLTNRDRAVSKEELLKEVWPETVVDENNLPRHISTLRKVLGETAGSSTYIETVPGWGYSLTCAVERLSGAPVVSASPVTASEVTTPAADAHRTDLTPGPTTATTAWFRRPAVLAAAATVASLIAIGGFYLSSGTNPQPVAVRALRQVTFQPGHQEGPAWSPDGTSLAVTSDHSGNLDIYLQSLNGSELTRLTSSKDHDWQPSWAPDGQRIAFRSERDGGGIYIVGTSGIDERRLTDFGYQPRWSPNGSRILVSTGLDNQGETSRLFLVDPTDATSAPFVPEQLAGVQVIAANWHPSGQQVSLWTSPPTGSRRFVTVSLPDGSILPSLIADDVSNRISTLGLTLRRFVWAPSGRFLYFEGTAENVGSVWRIGVDPVTRSWVSGPDRLTTGAGQDSGISLSADGTKLAFGIVSARNRLWTLPFDAAAGVVRGSGEPVELGAEDPTHATVAADGRTLIYRTMRAGHQEIRERSLADGREHVLLAGTTTSPPQLSKDGTQLAYLRDVAGAATRSVFVLPTKGGEERAVARLDGKTRWFPTDWAPDGSALIGTCGDVAPYGLSRLCLMPLAAAPTAEQHLQLLAQHPTQNLYVPRFSPDMRWISFIASDAGRSTVYIMPARGGQWVQLTDSRFQNDKLRWAPDGRAVYFFSNRTGFLNVWKRHIDLAGHPVGPLTQVTHFNSTKRMIPSSLAGMDFAVTADTLVLPLTEASSRIWLLEDVDK